MVIYWDEAYDMLYNILGGDRLSDATTSQAAVASLRDVKGRR
jgi:hypothetical protein